MHNNLATIVLGGGCFWCTEAVFQEVKGVTQVVSGYAGGTVPGHPTYREVCSGLTGHAEVVAVQYNPEIVSLLDLLVIFMTTHDPTTLNRQGADIDTHYRSVIFYQTAEEQTIAKQVLQNLATYYEDPIVTQVSPFTNFYQATADHQNYYKNNSNQGYCSYVISPKLQKLRKLHANKLK